MGWALCDCHVTAADRGLQLRGGLSPSPPLSPTWLTFSPAVASLPARWRRETSLDHSVKTAGSVRAALRRPGVGGGDSGISRGLVLPSRCWDAKPCKYELVWWRRPQAGTQNPEDLLPLPCCVSGSKLLALSGLVSQWRQRDRRAGKCFHFLSQGLAAHVAGGHRPSQKDTCPFDLSAGPEGRTPEPWALQTEAEQVAHAARRQVQRLLRTRRGKTRGRPGPSRGLQSLSAASSQARSLLRE